MTDADCTAFRELLLDLDVHPEAEMSEELAVHLDACAECQELRASLADVDGELSAMAAMEVPDALVERTLGSVNATGVAPERVESRVGVGQLVWSMVAGVFGGLWMLVRAPFRPTGGMRIALGLAGGAAALLAITFVGTSMMVMRDAAEEPQLAIVTDPGAADVSLEVDGRFAALEQSNQPANGLDELEGLYAYRPGAAHMTGDLRRQLEELGYVHGDWERPDDGESSLPEAEAEVPPEGNRTRDSENRRRNTPDRGIRDRWASEGEAERTGESDGNGSFADEDEGRDRTRARTLDPGDDVDLVARLRTERGARSVLAQTDSTTVVTGTTSPVGGVAGQQAARRFLTERARRTELEYVEAQGYWSNTYLPGDPGMRQLENRLRESGAAYGPQNQTALALAELADPNRQPFDPPTDAALAVYVHADRRGVEGPSRVMLQVGLKGIAHRSGRRPAMRVAVVLDTTRPLDSDEQGRVRALLEALSRARQTGDRIAVHVAGSRGGELVPSGELRYGQVAVAMRRLFSEQPNAHASPTSLPDALRSAATSVTPGPDEASDLGSSLVLLVTPGVTGDAAELERIAHVGTLAGVTTSVLGLTASTVATAEPIAFAGQGRRSVLDAPGRAAELVRAEVEAVSRVVARSVRLRIRLAAGVRLVDILGSRRLDSDSSARVRAAERAADLALASELGILSDRGEDEDGIQIVLPAFHADDAHVVLLDVVVPGPGPVVDVRARFKDLVRLRNGTADGTLTLGRVDRAPGPLELAVLKNVLAHEMATALREASDRLAAGDTAAAVARVHEARALLEGLRAERPELGRDQRITGDVDLAARYGAALGEASASGTTSTLVDSMRYAARRRR